MHHHIAVVPQIQPKKKTSTAHSSCTTPQQQYRTFSKEPEETTNHLPPHTSSTTDCAKIKEFGEPTHHVLPPSSSTTNRAKKKKNLRSPLIISRSAMKPLIMYHPIAVAPQIQAKNKNKKKNLRSPLILSSRTMHLAMQQAYDSIVTPQELACLLIVGPPYGENHIIHMPPQISPTFHVLLIYQPIVLSKPTDCGAPVWGE